MTRTQSQPEPSEELEPQAEPTADEAPAEDVPEGMTKAEDGTVAEGPELTAKDYDHI